MLCCNVGPVGNKIMGSCWDVCISAVAAQRYCGCRVWRLHDNALFGVVVHDLCTMSAVT
jgi:hypothetical protein